jgi:aspartate racemase
MSGFDETGIVNESLVKKQLIDSVKKLEIAGADFIVIACNTVHFFYKEMQEAVKIPILSIVEETKNKIIKFRFKKVGLLSSESTSKLKIYQNILDKSGIKVVSADKKQQKTLNNIIEDVMGGKQGDKDAKDIKSIIAEYVNRGAEAIVLGCTELPLAIKQSQVDIKIFNTTQIIAEAAVDFSLNKKI